MRHRPSWKEFKTFLVSKNGKWFDVYVELTCNLEFVYKLWRDVLDPNADLVKPQALKDCVLGLVSGKPLFLF